MKKSFFIIALQLIASSSYSFTLKLRYPTKSPRYHNINTIALKYATGIPLVQNEFVNNGFTHRVSPGSYSHYYAGFYLRITYRTGVELGIGKNHLDYKEAKEGVFPSGFYGKLVASREFYYLDFPLTFSAYIDPSVKFNIGYVPAIIPKNNYRIEIFGGAAPGDFQQTVLCRKQMLNSFYIGMEKRFRITPRLFLNLQALLLYSRGLNSGLDNRFEYKLIVPALSASIQFGEIHWNVFSDICDYFIKKQQQEKKNSEIQKKELEEKIKNQINNPKNL